MLASLKNHFRKRPSAPNASLPERQRKDWLQTLSWVLVVFIISRITIFAIGFIAHTQLLPRMHDDTFPWVVSEELPFLNMWGPWDTGWYLSIAEEGYSTESPTDEFGQPTYRNYAFFPAYPMLVRWIATPLDDKFIYPIGLALSNLFAAGSLCVIYLICRQLFYDSDIAKRTIILISFFPNSFVLSSFYTESFFMLLLSCLLLFSLHRRWWIAAIFGALLSATRVNGVTVVLPIACLILQAYPAILSGRLSKESRRAILSLLVYPIGLFSYMIFLHFHVGDAFAFLAVSSAWERQPGIYLHRMITDLFSGRSSPTYLAAYTLVGFLLIQYLLYRKQLILYVLAMILILPAFINGIPHNPFTSMPRYLLPMFMIPISLALLLQNKPIAFSVSLALLCTLNGMLIVYWVTGMSMVT